MIFSPTVLIDILASRGRAAPFSTAERLAAEIAACGSVQAACAALAEEEATDLRLLLLAVSSALREREAPEAAADRLRREACDLDARAEPAWAEAAEFAGKAAARRLQGQAELAADFARRSTAAEALAVELENRALALRLEAAWLQGAAARRTEISALLQGLAA